MKLMHVTKDSRCTHCGAGVIKCKEPTCKKSFHPANTRHEFHLRKCAQKFRRRRKQGKVIAKIRDELELDDE